MLCTVKVHIDATGSLATELPRRAETEWANNRRHEIARDMGSISGWAQKEGNYRVNQTEFVVGQQIGIMLSLAPWTFIHSVQQHWIFLLFDVPTGDRSGGKPKVLTSCFCSQPRQRAGISSER